MSIDAVETQRLIATFMSASAPVEKYLQQGRAAYSPGIRLTLSYHLRSPDVSEHMEEKE